MPHALTASLDSLPDVPLRDQREAAAKVPSPDKNPRGQWLAPEIAILKAAISDGGSPKVCARALVAGGFERTTKAIRVMASRLGLAFAKKDKTAAKSLITSKADIAFLKRCLDLNLSLRELRQAFAERGVEVSESLIAARVHELSLTRPQPEAKANVSCEEEEYFGDEEDVLDDDRGMLFVSRETAMRACAAHLRDLIRAHGVAPPDVALRISSAPRLVLAPLDHSPGGSAAAACIEG